MTALAVDRFAEGATRGGLTAWLSLLVRWFTRPSLSEAETALIDSLRSVAEPIGAPILAARSRAELGELLQAAAAEPILLRFSEEATRHVTLELLSAAAALPTEPPKTMTAVLGEGPARMLLQTGPLVAAAGAAFAQVIIASGGALMRSPEPTEQPARFFADPRVPSAVKRCVLAGLESTAALLAITYAGFEQRRTDGWMALGLVEVHRRGLYETLRLVASVPGVQVPESIVPLAERLDLGALEQAVNDANERWEQLGDAAVAAGGSLTLAAVPDDDDS